MLDACFHLFADEKLLPDEVERVVASMFPDMPRRTVHGYVTRFVQLFLASIYKWVQAPLSLHIGNLDLDRERALQLPVVTSAEWALTAEDMTAPGRPAAPLTPWAWLRVNLAIGTLSFGSGSRIVLYEEAVVQRNGWLTDAGVRRGADHRPAAAGAEPGQPRRLPRLPAGGSGALGAGRALPLSTGAIMAVAVAAALATERPWASALLHGMAIAGLVLLLQFVVRRLPGLRATPRPDVAVPGAGSGSGRRCWSPSRPHSSPASPSSASSPSPSLQASWSSSSPERQEMNLEWTLALLAALVAASVDGPAEESRGPSKEGPSCYMPKGTYSAERPGAGEPGAALSHQRASAPWGTENRPTAAGFAP